MTTTEHYQLYMVPKNITVAYELLLSQLSLSNSDIKKIFDVRSAVTVGRIKKPVLLKMAEKNIFLPCGAVHLPTAYEVWGLSEKELEQRYSKAKKFGLV